MIPKDKLKFDINDLKFYDRQLEDKNHLIKQRHNDLILYLEHYSHCYKTGKEIADKFKITTTNVRHLIAEIRRYGKIENSFITADDRGYTLAKANCCKKCNDNIIYYFYKTQTRWKETFYELKNLMKILNEVNNGISRE